MSPTIRFCSIGLHLGVGLSLGPWGSDYPVNCPPSQLATQQGPVGSSRELRTVPTGPRSYKHQDTTSASNCMRWKAILPQSSPQMSTQRLT